MRILIFMYLTLMSVYATAQSPVIKGLLVDPAGQGVIYANLSIIDQDTKELVKVETTNDSGEFVFKGLKAGVYSLKASYIGYDDVNEYDIILNQEDVDLGELTMQEASIEIETATITAKRAILEVKPDRTVFNVQGTINSAGDNGLSLLRKAPGVLIDNNNNISVLSRSGVLIYIDGKRLPLSGDQLTNYLQNLTAEQIDRIEIITNPGAKYEAEGNAGIIDIRLKKDENIGANGTLSGTASSGIKSRGNIGASGNIRRKKFNSFANFNIGAGARYNSLYFNNYQNGFLIDETNITTGQGHNYNFRLGTDFFIGKNHTIGFLIGGGENSFDRMSANESIISNQATINVVDSILIADNSNSEHNQQGTYNINYAFNTKKSTINIDVDYGHYANDNSYIQPNKYYNATKDSILYENETNYDTPVEIDILTFKLDYETDFVGGKIGLGTKVSQVNTDNIFKFYDVENGESIFNKQRSNDFFYDERVYAAYVSYQRPITEKLKTSLGLRTEVTRAVGDLEAYDPALEEDPINIENTKLFPTLGLSYQISQMHSLSLNYGKRINRPDYNVLNPFNVQLSELSYSKGNPRLNPEIVHNVEVSYTAFYRYNFKLGYSKTFDQITRLIAPDDEDPRAGFITWANLSEQTIYSANASLPIQFNKWWSGYFNLAGSYQYNQADYGDGAVVDLGAFSYSIYQQQTFNLPKKFTAEISGWYSGPGIWGGVFLYDPSWALNIGLQRKFFKDRLNIRVSANDIFYQAGWSGESNFNGLRGVGSGEFDSRRVSLSLSYDLGSSKIKSARKRKTGIEEELDRTGSGGGGQGQ